MPLFRRSRRPDTTITGFWSWWADEGRGLAEQHLAGGVDPARFAATMSTRLDKVAPLDWELAKGSNSEHVLVLTAAGNPDLRAVARRLVLAAPDADATWSFVDTRPLTEDPESTTLSAPGAPDVDFAGIRVGARANGPRLDVVVHHPVFAEVEPDVRRQVAYLALDSALGEIDAELWIGNVETSELAPLDGFGLKALRAVVLDVKSQHTDADGGPTWALLRGESPGGPMVASAQVPLHPLTAPLLDTYVAVVIPYPQRTEEGFPDEEALSALRAFEDSLVSRLGTRGALVAHQSVAGVRTLHLYVDGAADLSPAIREVSKTWRHGPVSVHELSDPAWDGVRHLRG